MPGLKGACRWAGLVVLSQVSLPPDKPWRFRGQARRALGSRRVGAGEGDSGEAPATPVLLIGESNGEEEENFFPCCGQKDESCAGSSFELGGISKRPPQLCLMRWESSPPLLHDLPTEGRK